MVVTPIRVLLGTDNTEQQTMVKVAVTSKGLKPSPTMLLLRIFFAIRVVIGVPFTRGRSAEIQDTESLQQSRY